MKSLKRTLCLVLALVMVLGLFGIASATNFTDDNQVQYKEAVEVVTGIGAINGMGDGTFNPKGTITRAQAATMVTRVALTAGVAADLTGIESSFTDVTVAGGFGWAIPSIEYMVKEGIINGRGDGTFDPNGQINGYAVLKMLLCVLGYGKRDEYIGDQWTLQVAVDASNKDNNLLAGRVAGSPLLSQPATREEVALYCYNALGARMVSYNKLQDKYDGIDSKPSSYLNETTQTAGGSTLADKVYGANTVEGVITVNGATNTTLAKDGLTTIDTFKPTDAGTTRTADIRTFKLDTGLDLIGHYVKVYYRADTTGKTAGIGYAVVDESTVVNVTKAIDNEAQWTAAFGTNAITKNGYTTGTINSGTGLADTTVNPYTFTNYSGTTTGALGIDIEHKTVSDAQRGTYILYKNNIYSFLQAAYTADYVSAYKAPGTADGSVQLGGSVTVTIPKDTTKNPYQGTTAYNLYDGIAKGDVVVKIPAGQFMTVVKATPVIGTVSAVSVSPKKTVTVNGTAYEAAAADGSLNDVGTKGVASIAAAQSGVVGKTCAVYLGPDGKVVAIVPDTGAVDSGLVYGVGTYVKTTSDDFGKTVYHKMLQYVNMDGTTGSCIVERVKDAQGAAMDADAAIAAGLITAGDDGGAAAFAAIQASLKNSGDAHGDYAGHLLKITALNEVEAVEGVLATVSKVSDGTAVTTDEGAYGEDKSAPGGSDPYPNKLSIAAGHYYSDSTVFLFVTGTGATLKVTTATGPQTITGDYSYYAQKAADNTYDVKYVVVKTGQVSTANGLMFTPAAFNTAKRIVMDNGKVGYEQNVYVDGVPTKVISKTGSGAKTNGFYTFSTDADGYCVLGAEITTNVSAAAQTLFAKVVHNGLLTTAKDADPGTAFGLTDADASNAKIVDHEYNMAVATGNADGKNPATSLDDIRGKVITYVTHKGANNQDVVDLIYVVGDRVARTITYPTTDQTASKGTGDGTPTGVFTVKVDKTSAATGDTVTVTVTVKTAPTGAVVVTPTVSDGNAITANPTSLSFAAGATANTSKTFTFTVGTANVTITTNAVENF